MKSLLQRLFLLLAFLPFGPDFAWALTDADLLPVDEAFKVSAKLENGVALLHWDIADGYYLYRKKFKFKPASPMIEAGTPEFPKGEIKHDEFFGDVEIYRKTLDVRLPLERKDAALPYVDLEAVVQGCADAGICYPPHPQKIHLDFGNTPVSGTAAAVATLAKVNTAFQAFGKSGLAPDLLPADDAFRFYAEVKDPDTLWVSWQIASGYYLYREKFKLALLSGTGVELAEYRIPHGEPRHDEEFGDVEIFHDDIGFALPLRRSGSQPVRIELEASFQGCAERGVCYPPMQKTAVLELPAGAAGTPAIPQAVPPPTAEQDRIADSLHHDSIWAILASFLGMGLLLAFTPCVFPMIPILSGIVVGHGAKLTTWRAFLLSLSYVLASALAYSVFGVLAGLFGGNLQAWFQEPGVIVAFSAVFVVLALSMFDLYHLEIPLAIQERVTTLSNRQHGGTLAGAAVMGALSALIVGPCVAAPLAGALIYIGQSGDWILGWSALFALGLGMGLPLLALGASAGKLLPKAGVWMNSVKAVFGVGMLAVAVWLLSRILPGAVTMLLWAGLLIVSAVYLGALESLLPHPIAGWRALWKGVGVILLVYGVLLLVGVASNQTDPLQPLRSLSMAANANPATAEAPRFRKVKNSAELDRELAAAAGAGLWTMLDFYADWCVSCKEMERYTFTDAGVRAALRNAVLLQADVTENTADDQSLLARYALVGPPATLFFGPDGAERKHARVVGYMDASQFLTLLHGVLP